MDLKKKMDKSKQNRILGKGRKSDRYIADYIYIYERERVCVCVYNNIILLCVSHLLIILILIVLEFYIKYIPRSTVSHILSHDWASTI